MTSTQQPTEVAIGAMALATLSGDWRDRTMAVLREYLPDYDKFSQAQQTDIIERITDIGEHCATESLTIVASKALPSMGMRVKGVARKGTMLTVQLEGPYNQANWNAWGAVEEMVAVQAAPDVYYGQKKPLYARPDQTAMDLGETDELGETETIETGDDAAAALQAEALSDEGEGEAVLGPEAIANGERLAAGIKPLEQAETGETDVIETAGQGGPGGGTGGAAGETEALDLTAAAPKKRGGRRSTEQRVTENLAAIAEPRPEKPARGKKAATEAVA